MVELKNKWLTVRVAEKGAELQSVKDNEGYEYMWQAGPEWTRHSPILFPIVCSVNDNTYVVDGKEYHLPRHGFARDMMFEIQEQDETGVVFSLHSDSETLEVYPFEFELTVVYRLTDRELSVHWMVGNEGRREMHFQIGAHPAFNVTGGVQNAVTTLLPHDNLTALKSYPDGSYDMELEPLANDGGEIDITEETFRNDSVKIPNSQVQCIMLRDKVSQRTVEVYFTAPVVALWTPFGKHAPFVCIEPWYGIGDPRGWKGEFRDKPVMNHLLPGARFSCAYCIDFK